RGAHGAVDQSTGRVRRPRVPRPDPRPDAFRAAARGADRRLLRPAQDPHRRLRLDGLRGDRLSRGEPGPPRRARLGRAGRRPVDHRAPRGRDHAGPEAGRTAARADPAADVRGAHPGLDRGQCDRPGNGARHAQERAGQVLRWRHHPEAQAAREAEGGQAPDEAGRLCRDSPGSVPGHAPDGRLVMEADLRVLVALGLTLLLVMLRLEAVHFGTAEYDEPVRGRRPSIVRRLIWYVLGVGGVAALLFIHPTAQHSLFLQVGDRSGIIIALIIGGLGIGQAVGLAYLHYRRLRFPDVASYPGAVVNEIITAFVDEAVFRGAVLGYFLWALASTDAPAGTQASLAILGQSVVYALATRLGAPGRDKYMLLLSLAVGL